MLMPIRNRIVRLAGCPASCRGTCCCILTAQRAAPSMLSNTSSIELPPVWAILPPCSLTIGSIKALRRVRSLSIVPTSSKPIRTTCTRPYLHKPRQLASVRLATLRPNPMRQSGTCGLSHAHTNEVREVAWPKTGISPITTNNYHVSEVTTWAKALPYHRI